MIKSLLRRWLASPQTNSRAGTRRSAKSLTLEHLEDRAVPAGPVASVAYSNVGATPAVSNTYVTDLFLDLLGRGPTTAELSAIAAPLTQGQLTAGGAFAKVVGTSDYTGVTAPILNVYEAALGRAAEPGGLAYWLTVAKQGTLGQAAGLIAQSPEFVNRNGNIATQSPTAFVTALYKLAFNRNPDTGGLNFWVSQLASGALQPGDVLAAFVQTPEYASVNASSGNQNLVNSAYVALWNKGADAQFATTVSSLAGGAIASPTALGDQFIANAHAIGLGLTRNYLLSVYENVFGHDPDTATYRSLRSQMLAQKTSDTNTFANLLNSSEYQQGVLPIDELYQVFLGRTADANGLTYWDAGFRGGASVAALAQQLASATEFTAKNGNMLALAPAAFVDALYQKVMKRTESASEQAYWVGLLNSGAETYGSLLVKFVQASEGQSKNGDPLDQNTAVFATRALVGHDPTAAALAQAVAALKAGTQKPTDVLASVLNGQEYLQNAYNANIGHTVVMYQENFSFDGLYGNFPGAAGLSTDTVVQVDKNGNPITALQQPFISTGSKTTAPTVDPHIPVGLPNKPYDLGQFISASTKTGDIVHRFYEEQYQIDGGKMDKFYSYSDNPGLAMSYFNANNLPEGLLAQQYTMQDMNFHSAFGGSFLNHQYLIAAQAPAFPNAPASLVAQINPATGQIDFVNNFPNQNNQEAHGSTVTPDGFAVNTAFSVNLAPTTFSVAANQLVPSLNDNNPNGPNYDPNIGDRLNGANVTWKWYSGDWNLALASENTADPNHAAQVAQLNADNFQWHHQAFAYFANTAPGTPGAQAHLDDMTNYFNDVNNGTLPAVDFLKQVGNTNEHPGYTDLLQGQQAVAKAVSALQTSKYWSSTSVFITYDEHGGRADQVAPPTVDRFGPGSRVPGIIISPFARRGFVDHTVYETDSILKTVENQYGLQALATRDAQANPMYNSYTFSPSDMIKTN
jgi:acid phosphatase